MHLQHFMPSINTSHFFTEHFVTCKPLGKFDSTFCLLKADEWFVRVVLTAGSASGSVLPLGLTARAQGETGFCPVCALGVAVQ